jgi:hypothetical protein
VVIGLDHVATLPPTGEVADALGPIASAEVEELAEALDHGCAQRQVL